jgi:damage-control phosphatase, subfamily I
VIGVVKGAPILTDATEEDATSTGMVDMLDGLLNTGVFAVGLDIGRMGDRLREEMASADLIIAKGMANFESLSDAGYGPIAYLMRAKCHPVAQAIGASKNDNVARLVC